MCGGGILVGERAARIAPVSVGLSLPLCCRNLKIKQLSKREPPHNRDGELVLVGGTVNYQVRPLCLEFELKEAAERARPSLEKTTEDFALPAANIHTARGVARLPRCRAAKTREKEAMARQFVGMRLNTPIYVHARTDDVG